MPDPVLARLRDRILSAAADRTPLAPVGGATKAFYGGRPPSGAPLPAPLPLGELTGIVAYEPSELVVVVRAGTPLAELEAALAAKGQMLGFEPPHFGAGATVGGCVAAGLSGPRRMAAGAVRDFVLGAKLLDARGRLLSFGGQVMKNVAGYDVARLLAGSLGTLGVIAEVSLKVLPRPAAEATLALAMDQAEALAAFDRWAGRPLPVSAAAWADGVARVRLSGARAAVDAAVRELGRGVAAEPAEVADAWWASLREQSHPFFAAPAAPGAALWRLALPAKVLPLALPGAESTLVEWGGAQRWVRTAAAADAIRAIASDASGHATRFRAAADPRADAAPVFTPPPAPVAAIERGLKHAFDPDGLFNPGRLRPQD